MRVLWCKTSELHWQMSRFPLVVSYPAIDFLPIAYPWKLKIFTNNNNNNVSLFIHRYILLLTVVFLFTFQIIFPESTIKSTYREVFHRLKIVFIFSFSCFPWSFFMLFFISFSFYSCLFYWLLISVFFQCLKCHFFFFLINSNF